MIKNKRREGFFGASDTNKVCGNRNTKTWHSWWIEKTNMCISHDWQNKYTLAGTHYEHAILDAYGRKINRIINKDREIDLEELKLKIHLDGDIDDEVFKVIEVKTFNMDKGFNLSKQYRQQVQAEMFGAREKFGKEAEAVLIAYPLTERNYKNYFLPIDPDLIEEYPIEYDEKFINETYLPNVKDLAECLKVGRLPQGWEKEKKK